MTAGVGVISFGAGARISTYITIGSRATQERE